MKVSGIKIGILCLFVLLVIFIYQMRKTTLYEDTPAKEVLEESDASNSEHTEEVIAKDNLLSTMSEAKTYKEYKLQDALRHSELRISKEAIESALKNLGRTTDNLLAAGLLIMMFSGEGGGGAYIREAFAKEKTLASYYLMSMEEQNEKFLEEYRNFDPSNVIPEMLLFAKQTEKGIRIDVAKLEEVAKSKTLNTGAENVNKAAILLLGNIGFEKEAADYLGLFVAPSNIIHMIQIPDRMNGNEYDPAKVTYSYEEKMRVLKSIYTFFEKKKSMVDALVEKAMETRFAESENNQEAKKNAIAKHDCLSALAKEVPVQDFTYREAEDFVKVVKERGELAAFFSHPSSQKILEEKGCK